MGENEGTIMSTLDLVTDKSNLEYWELTPKLRFLQTTEDGGFITVRLQQMQQSSQGNQRWVYVPTVRE